MRAQKAAFAAVGLVAGFIVLSAAFLVTSLFVDRPDGGTANAATPVFAGNAAVPCESPPIFWQDSKVLGQPFKHGRLLRGVQLPIDGDDFFSWDFPLDTSPNAPWRRWGADGTIRIVLQVHSGFHTAHPEASRIGIGDIARQGGGFFGKEVGGGLGHASHQNGTDIDIVYPRIDGVEAPPERIAQINRVYAQDLVDRFVAAGAQYVFVGPKIGLTGPKKVVQGLVFHDDQMHVRFPKSVVTETPPPPQTAPAPYVSSP
jgi:murein endopeptidase